MDLDALREATRRWVEAGIVDSETAAEIRAYEAAQETAADRETEHNRLVVALSVMGAVLVGAGILLYLAANWDRLSTAARTTVLVATPLLTGGVGLALARTRVPWIGHAPRVGHGCWFLAAAFLGPALFLLADLHAPEIDMAWLLLAWGVGALPAGHAFDSRPTTVLGLAVLVGAVVDASVASVRPFVVAFLGAIVVATGLLVRGRSDLLAGVYRVVGLATVTIALLVIAAQDGRYGWIELEPTTILVGSAVVAVAAAVLVVMGQQRNSRSPGDTGSRSPGDTGSRSPGDTGSRSPGDTGSREQDGTLAEARATALSISKFDATVVASPVAVTLAVIVIVAGTPPLPELVAFLLVHAVVLGLFVAIVVVATGAQSRALVNLVSLGFFVQVLLILQTTVAEALPGAVALVVAGLVLLGVGLALERGRRRLLTRIQ